MSNYTAPSAPTSSLVPSPTATASGPPYLPRMAQSGGLPTLPLDIPVSAVLLFLFLLGAATHMAIFQLNRRHNYKFLFSGLLFGFCMARVVALTMRIVWATRPSDVRVAIGAQIFTAAGVLLLFVINLVFAQRIIRACHPLFGWHRAVTVLFGVLFASIGAVLVMVVTVSAQLFFTLDGRVRSADRTVQLVCATYLAVVAALPIPIVFFAAVVPKRTRIDRFGEGHLRTKFALLVFTTTLLGAGAVFRAAAAFGPRPLNDPAWWHSKAAYYVFNYGVELVVVYTYALSRFDKRFHVPDGSSAPGHYSCAEFGESAAAVASAVAVFEKQRGGIISSPSSTRKSHRRQGRHHVRSASTSKRSSGWSAGKVAVPARVVTADRRSVKSARSPRSLKSKVRGGYVESRSSGGEDCEWMARAMRELYGDEETRAPRHSSHG